MVPVASGGSAFGGGIFNAANLTITATTFSANGPLAVTGAGRSWCAKVSVPRVPMAARATAGMAGRRPWAGGAHGGDGGSGFGGGLFNLGSVSLTGSHDDLHRQPGRRRLWRQGRQRRYCESPGRAEMQTAARGGWWASRTRRRRPRGRRWCRSGWRRLQLGGVQQHIRARIFGQPGKRWPRVAMEVRRETRSLAPGVPAHPLRRPDGWFRSRRIGRRLAVMAVPDRRRVCQLGRQPSYRSRLRKTQNRRLPAAFTTNQANGGAGGNGGRGTTAVGGQGGGGPGGNDEVQMVASAPAEMAGRGGGGRSRRRRTDQRRHRLVHRHHRELHGQSGHRRIGRQRRGRRPGGVGGNGGNCPSPAAAAVMARVAMGAAAAPAAMASAVRLTTRRRRADHQSRFGGQERLETIQGHQPLHRQPGQLRSRRNRWRRRYYKAGCEGGSPGGAGGEHSQGAQEKPVRRVPPSAAASTSSPAAPP